MNCEEVPCVIEFDVRSFDSTNERDGRERGLTGFGQQISPALSFEAVIPMQSKRYGMGAGGRTRIALHRIPLLENDLRGTRQLDRSIRPRLTCAIPGMSP